MVSNDGKNLMLTTLGTNADFMSVHSGYPATALNEISGGSPVYARKAITWGAASGGLMSTSNQPAFDIPANTDVYALGYWSAVTGGVLYGDFDATIATVPEHFTGQGILTVSTASLSLNK